MVLRGRWIEKKYIQAILFFQSISQITFKWPRLQCANRNQNNSSGSGPSGRPERATPNGTSLSPHLVSFSQNFLPPKLLLFPQHTSSGFAGQIPGRCFYFLINGKWRALFCLVFAPLHDYITTIICQSPEAHYIYLTKSSTCDWETYSKWFYFAISAAYYSSLIC